MVFAVFPLYLVAGAYTINRSVVALIVAALLYLVWIVLYIMMAVGEEVGLDVFDLSPLGKSSKTSKEFEDFSISIASKSSTNTWCWRASALSSSSPLSPPSAARADDRNDAFQALASAPDQRTMSP